VETWPAALLEHGTPIDTLVLNAGLQYSGAQNHAGRRRASSSRSL
jgi:hypothetical protein